MYAKALVFISILATGMLNAQQSHGYYPLGSRLNTGPLERVNVEDNVTATLAMLTQKLGLPENTFVAEKADDEGVKEIEAVVIDGVKTIRYNSEFIAYRSENSKLFGLYLAILHEIGHLQNNDWQTATHTKKQELKADSLAGYYLYLINCPFEELDKMGREIFIKNESKTHPSAQVRIKVLQKGWESAKSSGTEPVVNENVISKISNAFNNAVFDNLSNLKVEASGNKQATLLLSNSYCEKALRFGEAGNFAAQIAAADTAIMLNPNNAMAYLQRGNALYFGNKKYDEAIKDYTLAIEKNPAYAAAYYNRAGAFYSQNKFKEALADYTKAIGYLPSYAKAYANRGSVLTDLNEFDNAIDDYSKSIALLPENPPAFYNRAVLYSKQNKIEKAIADFTSYINLESDNADGYYLRGMCYYKLGSTDKAIPDLKQAVTKSIGIKQKLKSENIQLYNKVYGM